MTLPTNLCLSGIILSGNLLAKHLAINTQPRGDGRSHTIKSLHTWVLGRAACVTTVQAGTPAGAAPSRSAELGEGEGTLLPLALLLALPRPLHSLTLGWGMRFMRGPLGCGAEGGMSRSPWKDEGRVWL